MTKKKKSARGNNEKVGKEGRRLRQRRWTAGKQQRQHDSRWLARYCSLPVLYFFPLIPFSPVLQLLLRYLVLLVLSLVRASERRAPWAFIVFELDASLLCFVSCAIRGANCRSYAIAFCFLLLPPFPPRSSLPCLPTYILFL